MEIFLTVVLIIAAIIAAYITVATNMVKIKKIPVSSPKIPTEFDGVKIALLSDLHDAKLSGYSKKKLLEKTAEIKPDFIFLGGDMHEIRKKDKKFFSLLDDLKKIAPLYYVDGNHDARLKKYPDYKNYLAELEKRAENLHGKTSLCIGNAKIDLYGCGYFEYKKDMFDFDKNRFSVFLYHSPFVFDDFENPPDLMISGHIHGGVVELPFVGGVFAPADGKPLFARLQRQYLLPKYYKNTYEKNGGVLVVGRGIGNFKRIPWRLIPPEITEITLRRKGQI